MAHFFIEYVLVLQFLPLSFYPQCAADTQAEEKQNIARAHAHHPQAKSGGQTLVINFWCGGHLGKMNLVPIDSEKLYLAATLKIIALRGSLRDTEKNVPQCVTTIPGPRDPHI